MSRFFISEENIESAFRYFSSLHKNPLDESVLYWFREDLIFRTSEERTSIEILAHESKSGHVVNYDFSSLWGKSEGNDE